MNVKITRSWLLFIGLALLPFHAVSDFQNDKNKQTVYFYNPETNVNNFVSLKISFDTYLSKFGNYQFQPFNDKKIFEKSIIKDSKGVYLLSSWHIQYLEKSIDLHPLMVGVYKGQSTQKKILAVKQNITNIEQLAGKIIASSGGEQYTLNLLKEMLGDKYSETMQSVRLFLVPKDIDALMAVGYGMATAALTSNKSLKSLQQINPKQYKSLKILTESKDHYLAFAAIANSAKNEVDELLDILEKMGINSEGELRLRMIGIDGWRRFSKQEIMLLKQKKRHKGL